MSNTNSVLGLVTAESAQPIARKSSAVRATANDFHFGFFAALLVLINLAVFAFFAIF
jgi:hypothetical protein